MQRFSTRRTAELVLAWAVILGAIGLAAFCTQYAVRNFSIATDVRQLFPADAPWTERDRKFASQFPEYQALAIVDAPTAEFAERASMRLAAALRARRDRFPQVEEAQTNAFFRRNALLFVPTRTLARTTAGLRRAAPMIGGLAADPTLPGILRVMSGSLDGVSRGQLSLASLARPMSAMADTIDDALKGRPAHFSWRLLASGGAPAMQHNFIQLAPVLDFKSLEPSRAARDTILQTAKDLNLAGEDQANVRITGLAPMNDAQFSTLKRNAVLNAIVSIAAVLLILWLALRSGKLILASLVTVVCGLTYSAALGLFLVGSLNLISVAFFVLFVGLAVDFAIQFSVRYRAERHDTGEQRAALISAARKAGWPLALAGAATALGFSAFLPTSYRGLSELGKIAGPGMLIAFATNLTLLPALLRVMRLPDEPHAMGFARLAPIDAFLQRRRVAVLVGTLGVVLLASPLLAFLRFDFNTLHLQDPKAPAVAAFLSLRKDPATGANAAELVAANLVEARGDADLISTMPEVSATHTLASLVPEDQTEKLRVIRGLRSALGPALFRTPTPREPGDEKIVAALKAAAGKLSKFGESNRDGSLAAAHLSDSLSRLAGADAQTRRRASDALTEPLKISLDDLRNLLHAKPVTFNTIPLDLARQWRTRDGQSRVQILPKGDPDDTAALRKFVHAVLARSPDATGPAVTLYEAGNTVVRSFIEAGLFALVAIAILLWIALRRFTDVLMTLLPLLLAAVLTLELCVALDIPLNFTNIIAFPLLLGVGVAFKIYYIMAWRRGRIALVQSTLTRAVVFSALTTATAFGSLWLSRHPGTSSMGELMMLSLVCTMFAAVLFQPALMGPPRAESVPDKTSKTSARIDQPQSMPIAARAQES